MRSDILVEQSSGWGLLDGVKPELCLSSSDGKPEHYSLNWKNTIFISKTTTLPETPKNNFSLVIMRGADSCQLIRALSFGLVSNARFVEVYVKEEQQLGSGQSSSGRNDGSSGSNALKYVFTVKGMKVTGSGDSFGTMAAVSHVNAGGFHRGATHSSEPPMLLPLQTPDLNVEKVEMDELVAQLNLPPLFECVFGFDGNGFDLSATTAEVHLKFLSVKQPESSPPLPSNGPLLDRPNRLQLESRPIVLIDQMDLRVEVSSASARTASEPPQPPGGGPQASQASQALMLHMLGLLSPASFQVGSMGLEGSTVGTQAQAPVPPYRQGASSPQALTATTSTPPGQPTIHPHRISTAVAGRKNDEQNNAPSQSNGGTESSSAGVRKAEAHTDAQTVRGAAAGVSPKELASMLWTMKESLVQEIGQQLDEKLRPLLSRMDQLDTRLDGFEAAARNARERTPLVRRERIGSPDSMQDEEGPINGAKFTDAVTG